MRLALHPDDPPIENLAGVAEPLTMATDEEIEQAVGCKPGSIGPVNLNVPVIVDRSAAHLADFVCGANREGFHLTGVNWERDAGLERVEDLRNVVEGDPSPDGKGTLEIRRGIEVGHIFKLGNKYSTAMNATVLDENGKTVITVLHDLNQACRYCDHLIVMKKGAVMAQGTPDEVMTEELLKDVFDLDVIIHRDPISNTPMFILK